LFDAPRVTHTSSGIPGDPVNVALLGPESDVIRALIAAKWHPADPLTFRSSVRIAVDSVFRRPDEDAPVSTLQLFGRKQDLAFEQLAIALSGPSSLTYGELKLMPWWDPLRGDPRFEKIVASLAPKETSK
jgi:hypothetical protein